MLFGVENVMILRSSTIIAILMLGFSLLMLGMDEKMQIRFSSGVRDRLKKIFGVSLKS